MLKHLFLIALAVCSTQVSYANLQWQARIDSLIKELPATADTSKVKMLNEISYLYGNFNPQEGVKYAEEAVEVAKHISDKFWLGNAHNALGNAFDGVGNYPEALKNHFAAMEIRKELGNKKGVGGSYCNIGNIYREQGNYTEALNSYYAGRKVLEEIGDKKFLANTYYGMAVTHINLGNYAEALKDHTAALKIRTEMGDKQQMAFSYTCIGDVYLATKNYPEALKNYNVALGLQKEQDDKMGMLFTLLSVGRMYKVQANYPEALKAEFTALKMAEEVESEEGISNVAQEIAEIYLAQKQYGEAEKYSNRTLAVATKLGDLNMMRIANSTLSDIYAKTGRIEKALEAYKTSVVLRDSILNADNLKKMVRSEMQYGFDKKEAIAKVEAEKKDAITKLSIHKQKTLKNIFVGGFAVVFIFSAIVYRQRNRVIKEKQRSDTLLLNILPAEVAEELKDTGTSITKHFDEVTILFTDFVNFTGASERMSSEELINELNVCFKEFDIIAGKYNIEKIKTIGDAYLAVAGLPQAYPRHAENVVKAAIEIREFMVDRRAKLGDMTFEIRIGVHSGSVVAGIVGIKKFAYDIWGDTVNIAARMEQHSAPGKINISEATYELVKDKFACLYRGQLEAKNKGKMNMYFAEAMVAELVA